MRESWAGAWIWCAAPLPEQDQVRAAAYGKIPLDLFGMPLVDTATWARGAAIWAAGTVADLVDEPFFQPIQPEHLPQTDVFVQAYTDAVVTADVRIEGVDGLLSNAEWTTVHPCTAGDLRLLLDFGREVIGFQRFEIVASAGTIIDAHNFEFIQPDGRYNFAEGMNNSFRYICRAGQQQYQTLTRRGFQYSYLILRNMTGPVQLKGVDVLFNTYPQSRRGSFACAELRQRWESAGFKTSGSWEQIFGAVPETDEIFMAWSYASYVNHVARPALERR